MSAKKPAMQVAEIRSADDVVRAVTALYGLNKGALRGPLRTRFLVKARRLAAVIMKRSLNMSMAEIGKPLGRAGSTVYGMLEGYYDDEQARRVDYQQDFLAVYGEFRRINP